MDINTIRQDLLLSASRYYAIMQYDTINNSAQIAEDISLLYYIIQTLRKDCYYDLIDQCTINNINNVINDIIMKNCFLGNV